SLALGSGLPGDAAGGGDTGGFGEDVAFRTDSQPTRRIAPPAVGHAFGRDPAAVRGGRSRDAGEAQAAHDEPRCRCWSAALRPDPELRIGVGSPTVRRATHRDSTGV